MGLAGTGRRHRDDVIGALLPGRVFVQPAALTHVRRLRHQKVPIVDFVVVVRVRRVVRVLCRHKRTLFAARGEHAARELVRQQASTRSHRAALTAIAFAGGERPEFQEWTQRRQTSCSMQVSTVPPAEADGVMRLDVMRTGNQGHIKLHEGPDIRIGEIPEYVRCLHVRPHEEDKADDGYHDHAGNLESANEHP